MWLYYLAKIRWFIWALCAILVGIGIFGVSQGVMRGWIPITIGIGQSVYQIYINREARRPDVNPRDTIG